MKTRQLLSIDPASCTATILGLFAIAAVSTASADASDLSEILSELRRSSERLESIERRLERIESHFGTASAGLDLDGKALAVVPRTAAAPEAASPAFTPAMLKERGARAHFFRVLDLNPLDFAIPDEEPDASREAKGSKFTPDHVREAAGYPETVPGIVVWEGLVPFEEGRYEFQLGWASPVFRRHFNRRNPPARGSARIYAEISSADDGESITLEHHNPISDPKFLTVDLAAGVYRVRLAGPTDIMEPDPVYYRQYQSNSLAFRYRPVEGGSGWEELAPSALFLPPSSLD